MKTLQIFPPRSSNRKNKLIITRQTSDIFETKMGNP